VIPRENLQKSRFSRSVFADNPQILALQDPERNISKGPEVPLRTFLFYRFFGAKQSTDPSCALRSDVLEKGSLISFAEEEPF
jgi:hypothetical protein